MIDFSYKMCYYTSVYYVRILGASLLKGNKQKVYDMYFKSFIALALFFLALSAGAVHATTQSISANVSFDTTLKIINVTGIDFGIVEANQSGTYTISPEGVVTATNDGVIIGSTSQAGSLTITGSTTQTIDISTGNYVSNNGVTPSDATCMYDGGAATACTLSSQASPGAGKPLLLGVTVDVDGQQTASTTATPSFDVVVNYQ